MFWPVRQLRAAVEPNISLSQDTSADIHIAIHIATHRYVSSKASIELWSLNFRFTQSTPRNQIVIQIRKSKSSKF